MGDASGPGAGPVEPALGPGMGAGRPGTGAGGPGMGAGRPATGTGHPGSADVDICNPSRQARVRGCMRVVGRGAPAPALPQPPGPAGYLRTSLN